MGSLQPTGGGPIRADQDHGNVILDSSGNGEVQIGPVPPNTVWEVTRLTIRVTGTNNPMPRCYSFSGSPIDSNLMSTTYVGAQNTDDFSGGTHLMRDGEFLTVRWEGGVPGASATARIMGRQSQG